MLLGAGGKSANEENDDAPNGSTGQYLWLI